MGIQRSRMRCQQNGNAKAVATKMLPLQLRVGNVACVSSPTRSILWHGPTGDSAIELAPLFFVDMHINSALRASAPVRLQQVCVCGWVCVFIKPIYIYHKSKIK